MSLIERSEKRITDLIDAAPHPDGDFYADVLEVLRGRREQVETLRQQLAGAVETLRAIAATRPSDVTAGQVPVMSAWEAVWRAQAALDTLGGR